MELKILVISRKRKQHMLYLYYKFQDTKGDDNMAVVDEKVKKFEDEYKTNLFGMIDEFTVSMASLIQSIQTSAQYANINVELPNIGITLNNKIIELSHEFKNSGTSMFSNKLGNYGLVELDFVGLSLVGEALIENMMRKVGEATEALEKYDGAFEEMLDKRKNKSRNLQNVGPIKRALLKLSNGMIQLLGRDVSYTKEETECLNSFLSEYSAIDQELWKYTIRDNIIPSVWEYIKDNYPLECLPEIIHKSVVPELEMLGLKDLIPELMQKVEREFSEKNKSEKIGELSPELKKKIQQGQQEIAKVYVDGAAMQEPSTEQTENSIGE